MRGRRSRASRRCAVIDCALWPYRMGRLSAQPEAPHVSFNGSEKEGAAWVSGASAGVRAAFSR